MLNSKTYNSKHKLEEEENEAKPLQKTTAETSVEKQSKKKKMKNNQGKEKPIPQSLGSLNQKIARTEDAADENVIVIKGKANSNPNLQNNSEKKKKKKNKSKANGDTETSVPKDKPHKESSQKPKPKKSKTPDNEDETEEPPKPKKDKQQKPKPQKQDQSTPQEENKTENRPNPRDNKSSDNRKPGSKSQKRESRKMKQERQRAFVNNRFSKIMSSGERVYEICVSNLPKNVTEASLTDFFSGCGEVKKTTLESDKKKAFVQFDDPESVMNALEINEIKWEGVFLKIEKSSAANRPQERILTGESATTIFVANINPITSEESLKKFFESCGEIEQVRFHYAQDGKPRGFAHVKFKRPDSVDRAIVKGLEPLDDRTLKVERSSRKATGPEAQQVKPKEKPQEVQNVPEKKTPYIPDPKVQTEKDVGTIAKFQGTKVKL